LTPSLRGGGPSSGLPGRAGRWKPNTDLTDGVKRTVDWLLGILDPHPAALARA
jgi:hypothetical protein